MAVSLDQGYYISLRGSTRVLFLESKKGQHYAFAFARKAAKEKKGYVQRLVKAGNNVSSEAEHTVFEKYFKKSHLSIF